MRWWLDRESARPAPPPRPIADAAAAAAHAQTIRALARSRGSARLLARQHARALVLLDELRVVATASTAPGAAQAAPTATTSDGEQGDGGGGAIEVRRRERDEAIARGFVAAIHSCAVSCKW